MELLRDAEPIVETSAAVLEDAGFGAFAGSLRRGLPLRTLEGAFEVAAVLQEVQELAGLDPEFDWFLGEMAFWAQGAILSAADGDLDLFQDCWDCVKRVLLVVAPKFALH